MTEQMHQIHQVIEKSIENNQINGASYSSISPNEIEMRYEGVQATNDQKHALDPSMIYDISSMTEVVATATRIFQLLAIQELRLKDPVQNYLPGFANQEITILHLLTHTSGLPVAVKNMNRLTGLEFTNALYTVDVDFEPGERVQISPLNFAILGIIIRTVDGSIDRAVQDRILYPLAMTNTGFNLNRPKARFVPTRHDRRRGQIQGQVEDELGLLLNGESGHAGLFSTLNDLTVFTEMMINRGSYQGKELLDPRLFDVLDKINIDGQSLGWRRSEQNDAVFYANSPTGLIAFNPKTKQGMVVLHGYIEDENFRETMLTDLLKVI